ncbi:NPG1 [Scenedesmus sp. PABB004]|nr:NPG1 [Scenedesmus sp. PABB004]
MAAELLLADLAGKQPVGAHLQEWLDGARQLLAAGEAVRARLALDTVLQAAEHCLEAHVLLVHTHLALGPSHWQRALAAARDGVATCCALADVSAEDRAACHLALGLALGSVARLTAMPQADRSRDRSEARAVLAAAAAEDGAHRVASLYALALIDAEGGHYDTAVRHAQHALEAAEAGGAGGGAPLAPPAAPIVALLALLLSARQQPQAALTVVEAGLASVGGADRCDAPAPAAGAGASLAGLRLPWCYDVLLCRVRAALLLALADANGALGVLGAAKQRLSLARRALEARGPDAGAAAGVLRQQEAQVWRDLALAYVGQRQPADAQLCVEAAAALEPHSAATYHAAGCVAAARKDAVAAKAAYKAALAVDAAHPPALLSLGALLRRQGDPHDLSVAASLLTDALRYEPLNHVAWFNLGLARNLQGHTAEGERHLFTAVTLAAAAPVLAYSELPLSI